MADTAGRMKRFWTSVSVTEAENGSWEIALDGKPLRTPARVPLAVPSRALADAIAEEWATRGEQFDPRDMPLTGLANAALDRIAPARSAFADDLARYAEADVTCYRADEPAPLVVRQAENWDPLLDWARSRYDVHFEIATGIIHKQQPAATIDRLSAAVRAYDPFMLAALSPLVTISGSLIAALAVLERHIDPMDAFDVTHLDEYWQAEQWGEDELARDARDARKRDFLAAARFLYLLD
jgi:chaperone required for assembly of F1-ATPase